MKASMANGRTIGWERRSLLFRRMEPTRQQQFDQRLARAKTLRFSRSSGLTVRDVCVQGVALLGKRADGHYGQDIRPC